MRAARAREDLMNSGFKVDWAEIADQFRSMRSEVQKCSFPSREEIDCYKASLAAPRHVRSALLEQLAAHQRHYIQDKDRLQMLQFSFRIFGAFDYDAKLPTWFRENLPNHMEIVEKLLSKQSLTLEFINSWGELKFANGLLSAILFDDESAYQPFVAQMAAAVAANDTTLQKYWYSHWMAAHRVFDRRIKRPDLDAEFGLLCDEIVKKRRKPQLYSLDWYRSLLEYKTDPEAGSLKTPYVRLSVKEISRIVGNPLIPRSALPPLSTAEFQRIESDRP
jgi:hypothetical protein